MNGKDRNCIINEEEIEFVDENSFFEIMKKTTEELDEMIERDDFDSYFLNGNEYDRSKNKNP